MEHLYYAESNAVEKRWVFSRVLKMLMEGEERTVCGNLFHSFGPANEKALSPLVF